MAEEKEHTYPKTQNTDMKKAPNTVLGDTQKQNSYNGPHLTQGKGNMYNQAKLGSGFLAQDPRTGHTQKGNMEDNVSNKK